MTRSIRVLPMLILVAAIAASACTKPKPAATGGGAASASADPTTATTGDVADPKSGDPAKADANANKGGDSSEGPAKKGTDAPAADAPLKREIAEIMAAIKARRQPVQDCFKAAWAKDKSIGTKLTIKWKVDPEGAVTKVEVNESRSDLKDPSVIRCATDLIKSLKFVQHDQAKETDFNYPFEFVPPKR